MTSTEPGTAKRATAGRFTSPALVLFALSLLAFSTRLLPLSISSFPFNNDGLTECRIATDILSHGHLHFSETTFYFGSHVTTTPAYAAFLAFISSALGVSSINIAQVVVAMISLLTVAGGYLLGMHITGSRQGGLAAALVLGLFGTFVFLTGSTWRESLGVALLVLLYFAYIKRNEPRMLVLEMVMLALLPLVHHLVTVIAYMSVAFLTTWSLYFAVRGNGLGKRHIRDLSIIALFCVAAILYYKLSSFDRLVYVAVQTGLVPMAFAFVAACVVVILVLRMKKHSKITFSPVPAIILFGLAVWNYYHPLFPYSPGAPQLLFVLFAATGFLVFLAWLGLEVIVESKSMYRAIPLGMLLPVCALFLFAVISESGLSAHQILYRGFDFADLSIAMGVGIGLVHFGRRPKVQRYVTAGLIAALVLSFPFAYATNALTGVRHDTQAYEVDALGWMNASAGPDGSISVQSDERMSYIGMAMFDFEKMPYLPKRMAGEATLGTGTYYVMEDEWTTVGVNSYPDGHPVVNASWAEEVLASSHVLYIGGPHDNRVTIFMSSVEGQEKILHG